MSNLPSNWITLAKVIINQIQQGYSVKDIFPEVDLGRIRIFIIFFRTELKNYHGKNKDFVNEYIDILDQNFNSSKFNKPLSLQPKKNSKVSSNSSKLSNQDILTNKSLKKLPQLILPALVGSYLLYSAYKTSIKKRKRLRKIEN